MRWRALRLAALPARRAIGTSDAMIQSTPQSGRRPRDGYDTADSMTDFNRLLTDNLAIAFGVLGALVVLLLIAVMAQSVRLGRAVRAYRDIVREPMGATSLHDLLAGNADAVERASERMSEMETVHATLDQRTRRSIQHIGMVRFNPFEDTGSDQSFAIALLDDQRDGIVLSGLHGRANTRIFAKPVEAGASTNQLSDEESEAIRIALSGTRAG